MFHCSPVILSNTRFIHWFITSELHSSNQYTFSP